MSFTCGPPVSSNGGGASGNETYLPSVYATDTVKGTSWVHPRTAVELDPAHTDAIGIRKVAAQNTPTSALTTCA